MLGNGPHVLGNGPHVLGNGPHVLGNGPQIQENLWQVLQREDDSFKNVSVGCRLLLGYI